MTIIRIQKLMRSDLDDMVLEYCKLFGMPEKIVYIKQGNKECADIYYNTKIKEVPSEIHRANEAY